MNKIELIYNELFRKHGPQGWWPINGKYHPNDYLYPHNPDERYEICVGAILTQNTAWRNVERALSNLNALHAINPEVILDMKLDVLASLIRPAGYFNQKARKLKEFSQYFINFKKTPTRGQLLAIWGIGPETADSILLYAYSVPVFVVDAYARRFLLHHRLIEADWSYDRIQKLFHDSLPADFKMFQEFHALIVEEGKNKK